MSETKIESYYMKRAEEIIDTLFDAGYFTKEVTRKDMRKVEELLAYYFQSGAESAVKADRLVRRIHSPHGAQEERE